MLSPKQLYSSLYSLKEIHLISGSLLIVLLSIAGCSHPVVRTVETPDVANQGRFLDSGSVSPQDQWWKEFNDLELNQLIETSLSENLSLAQAWSRLAQASASLQSTESSRYPSLNLGANARRQFQDASQGAGSTNTTSGSTTFSANYELDLWGKVRNQNAGAYFNYLASEQDLQTAAISLAAQVANTWFTLIEKQSQRQMLEAQLKTAEQTLESIRIRFENGNRNGTDLLQQEQAIEARRASLILNRAEIKVLENSLSVLLGKDPSTASFDSSTSFPTLAPFPSTGLPAETLGKRPDIQSSWLEIQSADTDVAVAIANRFPSITLGGTISSAFSSSVDLFENWIKSLTANLVLPLIDGGARKAEVERREMILRNAILGFQSDYLNAIREVEDAIIQEKQQSAYLESLNIQINYAERVFEQTLNRYKKGNQTYLQVLTAENSLLNLQRTHISANRALLNNRVALYRAIGGGFELPNSIAWSATATTEK